MAQPTQERLAAQLEKPEQTSGNVGHAGSGTGPENSPHFEEHEDDHVHHVAMSTYYVVFAFLIVMLLVTVGAWYVDQHVMSLGHFSTPIAMAIAVAKAVAIVLIFMHVKFASKLVQIFACTGVAFVAVMFTLTLQDYVSRDALDFQHPGVYSTATAPHIRASSVGAGYNSQSTPSDNMAPMSGMVPNNVGTTAMSPTAGANSNSGVLGANISVAPGNTSPGVAASSSMGQTDESRPGAIIGGAANNSFGSSEQSAGIEPKTAASAVKPGKSKLATAMAAKPAPATR